MVQFDTISSHLSAVASSLRTCYDRTAVAAVAAVHRTAGTQLAVAVTPLQESSSNVWVPGAGTGLAHIVIQIRAPACRVPRVSGACAV